VPDTDPLWRKSSRSNASGNCVQVARFPDAVGVRDSKNPDGGALVVPGKAFATFVNAIKAGTYDVLP
jgi:hypothetical protein